MGKYIQGFKGMRQDINESNMDPNYYYYAKNLTTSSDDNISNIGGIGSIKSDKLIKYIPTDDPILGDTVNINGGIEVDTNTTVVFATYTRPYGYLNAIFLIQNNGGEAEDSPSSIYKPRYGQGVYTEDDWGVLPSYKISLLHNKENELVNKIYWIDGFNQVRSLNIASIINGTESYLTTSINLLDATTKVDFSNITTTIANYNGVITAGKAQYAYAYFNQNGQSTGVSPLSDIIPLTKSDGQGGDVNQIVGQSNSITIDDIDTNYDYIQLYRVKYNTESEDPIISLIQERILESTDTSISFLDTGVSINEISTEAFLFLGSDIYYPKAFEIKDDRMFISNFTEENWDITNDQVDTRAYRFGGSNSWPPVADIDDQDNNDPIHFTYINLTGGFVPVPETHDCIQSNYENYNLKGLGGYGASGVNFELSVTEANLDITHSTPYYRGGETYRFGVIFINSFGKKSTPLWVCDYKMPDVGKSYSIEIELLTRNLTQAIRDDLDIKGFIGVRVERDDNDRFIVASGVSSGCMYKSTVDSSDSSDYLFDNTIDDTYINHSKAYINRESDITRTINYPMYTNYYPHWRLAGSLIAPGLLVSGFDTTDYRVNTNYSYNGQSNGYSQYINSYGYTIKVLLTWGSGKPPA